MDEQRKKRLIAKYSKSSAKRPEGSGRVPEAREVQDLVLAVEK